MTEHEQKVWDLLNKLMLDAVTTDGVEDQGTQARAKRIGDTVTATVGFLGSLYPNEHINKLMRHVWNLIGSQVTPVMLGMPVDTPTVAIVGGPQGDRMAILMPSKWPSEDESMSMAALIFCGSQGVDFYNGRIRGEQASAHMSTRAMAYEAEFLLTWARLMPGWEPNEYQLSVLRKFPRGVATPGVPELMYESIPTPSPVDKAN